MDLNIKFLWFTFTQSEVTFPQSLDGLEDLEDLEDGFSEENLQMIVSMDGKDLETALAASKTTILWSYSREDNYILIKEDFDLK